jgi:hypothetical protein
MLMKTSFETKVPYGASAADHARHSIKLMSSDRESYSASSSNFTLNLKSFFLHGAYSLSRFFCPNSIYNVDSRNNLLRFTDNNGAATATITSGWYTTATFPAAVKSALDTASGGVTYTVSISSTSGKILITPSAGNLTLRFSTTANSAAPLLGFNNVDTAAATSQTGDNIVNLNYLLSINVTIENEPEIHTSTGNCTTFCIPIDVNSQEFISWSPLSDSHAQIVYFNNPVKLLNLKLVDDSNNVLNLNGGEWYMLLRKIS